MKQIVRALAVSILAFAALPNPAGAETPPSIQIVVPDPHEDLYAAINEVADQDVILDNMLLAMIDEFRRQFPKMTILEDNDPTFAAKLQQSMKPTLIRHSARLRAESRTRMIDLIREVLTAEEAISVAAFYRSDLGRKVGMNASQAYNNEATIQQIAATQENLDFEGHVAAITADSEKAGIASVLALSVSDRAKLTQITRNLPGLKKLEDAQPRFITLRAEIGAAPMTPEDKASLQSAIEAVFDAALANLE